MTVDGSHIVITGPMAAGKTTVARATSALLSIEDLDNDADIQLLFGHTGAELVEAHGVEVLHRVEAAVLLGALARRERLVIAAAGSVVDDELAVMALVERAQVFWLDLPLEVQLERISSGGHRREIEPDEQQRLNERRSTRYRELGWHRLDATRSPEELAEIVGSLVS